MRLARDTLNQMVNDTSSALDRTFSALSDPTRRAILSRLTQGEATVGELAEPFSMSLPAISKHLKVLEEANLIVRQREGRQHFLRLAADPLKDAASWLHTYRGFWDDRFDGLAAYLDRDDTP